MKILIKIKVTKIESNGIAWWFVNKQRWIALKQSLCDSKESQVQLFCTIFYSLLVRSEHCEKP